MHQAARRPEERAEITRDGGIQEGRLIYSLKRQERQRGASGRPFVRKRCETVLPVGQILPPACRAIRNGPSSFSIQNPQSEGDLGQPPTSTVTQGSVGFPAGTGRTLRSGRAGQSNNSAMPWKGRPPPSSGMQAVGSQPPALPPTWLARQVTS